MKLAEEISQECHTSKFLSVRLSRTSRPCENGEGKMIQERVSVSLACEKNNGRYDTFSAGANKDHQSWICYHTVHRKNCVGSRKVEEFSPNEGIIILMWHFLPPELWIHGWKKVWFLLNIFKKKRQGIYSKASLKKKKS